jgi:hypothetical protein
VCREGRLFKGVFLTGGRLLKGKNELLKRGLLRGKELLKEKW